MANPFRVCTTFITNMLGHWSESIDRVANDPNFHRDMRHQSDINYHRVSSGEPIDNIAIDQLNSDVDRSAAEPPHHET